MKDEMKKLKEIAEKAEREKNYWYRFSAEVVIKLLAEIESLEVENRRLQAKVEELEKTLQGKKIKIEHLVKDIKQMKETIVECYGSGVENKLKELDQLKQDYKILHTASDEVLKTIVWLCEHEPDNILIPQGLQAMCGCLQQALAKEK